MVIEISKANFAKGRGALATGAQLDSLLSLALWALSFCGQIGIKGNLQVLDVQHSNSFWSMPSAGVSSKLGSQTQKKVKGKEQPQSLFYSLIWFNFQHSYFGPLISGFMLPLFIRNYLNTAVWFYE